jgi:cell wall-associated NlpC family hydrolase
MTDRHGSVTLSFVHRPSRRTSLYALALLAVIGVLLGTVSPVAAQSVDDKRSEAKQIAQRLAQLQDQQQELSAKYERANFERQQADEKVAAAQAESDETNRELDTRRDDLRKFAVTAYEGGSDTPSMAALMSDEANDGTVAKFYLESTTGNRGDLIDSLRNAQAAADEKLAELNAARDDASARVKEIDDARDAAAAATAQQDALNDRVQGELASMVAEEAAAYAASHPSTTASNASSTSTAPAATSAAPSNTARRSSSPAPAPSSEEPATTAPPVGSGASGAIAAALSKVGSPYVWGAAGPNAFDCSGLVAWAYGRVGVSLPHYSGAQYAMTTRISASQLQPGDLVFWGPGGSEHVAIYMGGNQLVHAYTSGRGVGVTALNGWWKTPSGYGRLNY